MNLKFEEFKKNNFCLKELDNIRVKSFKKFEAKGFPTKKQEHWKYTDLRNIIYNNFQDLQIFNEEKTLKNLNLWVFQLKNKNIGNIQI